MKDETTFAQDLKNCVRAWLRVAPLFAMLVGVLIVILLIGKSLMP